MISVLTLETQTGDNTVCRQYSFLGMCLTPRKIRWKETGQFRDFSEIKTMTPDGQALRHTRNTGTSVTSKNSNQTQYLEYGMNLVSERGNNKNMNL